MNFLSNAIKFVRGKGRIQVYLCRVKQVADNYQKFLGNIEDFYDGSFFENDHEMEEGHQFRRNQKEAVR